MITKEKLQNFLDDLRIGKYDNLNYKIRNYLHFSGGTLWITDVSKDIKMRLAISKVDEYDHKGLKSVKIGEHYEAFIESEQFEETIYITKELFESFHTYMKEVHEQDKLIARTNIEAAFGL